MKNTARRAEEWRTDFQSVSERCADINRAVGGYMGGAESKDLTLLGAAWSAEK
jgi:hypothetical protein